MSDTASSDVVQPNGLFDVWSPDEVAECLEGVSDDTYRALWEFVADYDGKPRSEVPDDFECRALSKFWPRLTPEQKHELNAAAVALGSK